MPASGPEDAANQAHNDLERRIAAAEVVIGTFFKCASPSALEALGGCGLDFVILDAEHNPYDRSALDHCLLAARSVGLPALVRVPDTRAETILNALDCGAAGIVAPHIGSADQARALVAATRYHGGDRGFSAATRAGGYGRLAATAHIAAADASVSVIAQIEDQAGVDAAAEIAAVAGVDALLIGPADLSVALRSDALEAAITAIIAAGKEAGCSVGSFVPKAAAVAEGVEKGLSLFAIGTELGMLRGAVSAMTAEARQAAS